MGKYKEIQIEVSDEVYSALERRQGIIPEKEKGQA